MEERKRRERRERKEERTEEGWEGGREERASSWYKPFLANLLAEVFLSLPSAGTAPALVVVTAIR